jgi:hypothetical protein
MARGRIGSLSRKTFFPGTGDQMENTADGIVFACVRSNKFETNGSVIQYGLLQGVSSDGETFFRSIDSEDKDWLNGVTTIRRLLQAEGVWRTYTWAEETGTWRQVRVSDGLLQSA